MAQDTQPIWKFIRLEEYRKPTEPAREAVRKGVRGLWQRLRQHPRPAEYLIEQKDLHQVPQQLLEQAAPTPTWDAAVSTLTAALEGWLGEPRPRHPVQILLGPPYSGIPDIAMHWTRANDWQLLEAPSPEQVLAGGAGWLEQLKHAEDTALVIPALEHCYLRHHDGLALIRQLIKWVCARQQRCLLGCNSWTWAYFRKAVEAEVALPSPIVLQAFDQDRLRRWFRLLADNAEGSDFQFLQESNGKPVLPPPSDEVEQQADKRTKGQEANDRRPAGVSDFLNYVAGHCRGIPLIAWSIWRRSLQVATEERVQEATVLDTGRILWVRPWTRLDLPSVPLQHTQSDLFVLHALLLHGGLPTDLLPVVLPSTPTEIMQALHHLHACGLLSEVRDRWQITSLGYPAVRRVLVSEGYLVDQF